MQGKKRIFACTVFFIEWNGCTSILTSASLLSDFVDDKKILEDLRVGSTNYSY
jgi:NifU-like protein involved in Fe-S cluster formation